MYEPEGTGGPPPVDEAAMPAPRPPAEDSAVLPAATATVVSGAPSTLAEDPPSFGPSVSHTEAAGAEPEHTGAADAEPKDPTPMAQFGFTAEDAAPPASEPGDTATADTVTADTARRP